MGLEWTSTQNRDNGLTLHVVNRSQARAFVQVDPWALAHSLEPGECLQVVFEASRPGSPDVECRDNLLHVWAWSSAVGAIHFNGEKIAWSTIPWP